MTKKEAAEYLGVTERTLERYTSQGRLGVRYEKGKTHNVASYDVGELERFKAELEKPTHRPAVQRMDGLTPNPDSDMSALSPLSGPAGFDMLEKIIAATANSTAQAMLTASERPQEPQKGSQVQIADKLLLTLAECQQMTGLSRQTLRQAISEGNLKAKQAGRSWRIKRADLEKFIDGF